MNRLRNDIPGTTTATKRIGYAIRDNWLTKPISLLDVLNYIENIRGKIQEAIIYVFTINDKGARYVSDLSKRTKLKLIVSDIIKHGALSCTSKPMQGLTGRDRLSPLWSTGSLLLAPWMMM